MLTKPLSRRMVLRGAVGGLSAAVALPILDAMLDENGEAFADGSDLPCRFMTWMFGNGVRLDKFVPQGTDPWTPSVELMPLQDLGVKDYVSVLTGFDNHSEYFITHHEGMTVFSGHDLKDVGAGQGIFSNAGGPTIDQAIAKVPGVGDQTTIPSVQVGISKRPSDADYGTTTHNLSHKDYLQPLPPVHYPKQVWAALFDSFVPPEDPQGPLRTSVLDIVRGQIAGLKKRLGSEDRQRLDAHLEGISALEKKIEALPPVCESPMEPVENNQDVGGKEPLRAVAEVMSDLIVHAFKCDITRVASFLFVEPAALTVYSELGHTSAFHNLTHSNDQTVQENQVHEGVIFAMESFGYLLKRMMETEDVTAGGNLLDNSIVFCSTECSEGWSHSIDKQPMLVAGGGSGKLVHPGIHYPSPSGENPTSVLLGLLQLFDPSAAELGSGQPWTDQPFDLLKV